MQQLKSPRKISVNEVLYELKRSVRSSGLSLSRHLIAPDIYDRFKKVIDRVALERKRDYFYPKSYFNDSISSEPDAVVDSIKESLQTLVTLYRAYEEEFREIGRSGVLSTSMLRHLINKNEAIFIKKSRNLFTLLKRMYKSDSDLLFDELARIQIVELVDLIMIYAGVVCEVLFAIKSPKGEVEELADMYDEFLLKFTMSSAMMIANVLGHWSDKVLHEGKNNFIDAEFIIILMAIGSMIAYLLQFYDELYDEYEDRFSAVRKEVSDNILRHFANTVDTWYNIVAACDKDADCIVSALQNTYEDPSVFPDLDELMSLLSR